MSLASVLEWLGLAARHAPAVGKWLADLADGDKTAAEQLRAVLPFESQSAAAVREFKKDS